MCRTTGLFLVFILLAAFFTYTPARAQQNVDYRSLAFQSQQQNVYISHFTLPGDKEGMVKFVTTFRISNQFMPFKKIKNPDGPNEFFSNIGLSLELFKADKKVKKDNSENLNIKGLESVARDFWRDTAYATTYEKTQSADTFIEGSLEMDLKPGLYNYILQVERGDEKVGASSRTRQVNISSFEDKNIGNLILGESISRNGNAVSMNLLNYGGNARYGKDYYVLFHLPGYEADKKHTLTVSRIDASEKDTTEVEETFSKELGTEEIYEDAKPTLSQNKDKPSLNLDSTAKGAAFALVKIPNSRFPNATYRVTISSEERPRPLAQGLVRSFWPEIPTSLLNLNTAIEMTKYIVSESRHKQLRSGSRQEKEKKFREFWESKDPTPDTEYNELMTEYYNRVDYAYEQFSSVNNLGFETDRGQVYIKYGEPDNIERRFPAGEPTVEIWTYGSRRFVFRATSGFGDFKLVGN